MLKEYQSNCLSLHNLILPIHTRINKLSHMHLLVWINKRRKFVFSALEARHLPWRCYLGGGSTRFNPTPNLTEFPQRNTFGTTEFFCKQFGLDWGPHFSKLVVSGGSEILSKTKAFKNETLRKTMKNIMSIMNHVYDILWSKSKLSESFFFHGQKIVRNIQYDSYDEHDLRWHPEKKTSDFWVLDHVPGLRSFSGLMESTAKSPFKIWRSKAIGISKAALTMYQNFSNHQPMKTIGFEYDQLDVMTYSCTHLVKT